MPICTGCEVDKEVEDFPWRKKGIRRQTRCKVCQKAAWREHYGRNRKYYLDRTKNARQALVAEIQELKNKPCADCEVSYPYYVMDFDHRPGEVKLGQVGSMVRTVGRTAVMAEIAKCDVVCANCHRERTHGADSDGV